MVSEYDPLEFSMRQPYTLRRPENVPRDRNECPICLREFGVAGDQDPACHAVEAPCGHLIGSECFIGILCSGRSMRCSMCLATYPRDFPQNAAQALPPMTLTRRLSRTVKCWPYSTNVNIAGAIIRNRVKNKHGEAAAAENRAQWNAVGNNLARGEIDAFSARRLYLAHFIAPILSGLYILSLYFCMYIMFAVLTLLFQTPSTSYFEVALAPYMFGSTAVTALSVDILAIAAAYHPPQTLNIDSPDKDRLQNTAIAFGLRFFHILAMLLGYTHPIRLLLFFLTTNALAHWIVYGIYIFCSYMKI